MRGNEYIAIEGVIGIGKTTLARLLQPHYDATVLLEVFEENPFLADFYGDRERYAFQTQIFFLLSRYHQQNKAVPEALSKGMLVSDYTFAKDELFAWLNLKDDELSMYGRVHAALSEKIPRPDLIVFLTADHDVVMRRIALRDHAMWLHLLNDGIQALDTSRRQVGQRLIRLHQLQIGEALVALLGQHQRGFRSKIAAAVRAIDARLPVGIDDVVQLRVVALVVGIRLEDLGEPVARLHGKIERLRILAHVLLVHAHGVGELGHQRPALGVPDHRDR